MSAVMTKRLYALAVGLNLVECNNKEDNFHQLVFGLTGKSSVRELTSSEAVIVEHELLQRMKLNNQSESLKRKQKSKTRAEPGMMTTEQQSLAWRLVYRLAELEPTQTTVGERLVGAIKKELNITANVKQPFRWVDFENGAKLIEQLKRYVRSAERRAAKKAGAGSGY